MRLLVTKASTLGGNTCFLPALGGLLETEGVSSVTVLTTPAGREVFSAFTPLDVRTIPYRLTQMPWFMVGIIKAYPQLKGRAFDLSLHPHDDASFGYLLAWLLRIPRRIGYDFPLARLNRLCTERLPLDHTRNIVDINHALVRRVTEQTTLTPRRVPLVFAPPDQHVVSTKMRQIRVAPNQRFILIHSGARNAYRQWDKYRDLCRAIEDQWNMAAVLLTESVPVEQTDTRILGGLSIPQLACACRMSALFVGNNSGPMHIAGAMGTPTVVVQGPSAPSWSFYWDDVPHITVTAQGISCAPCERLDYYPRACTRVSDPEQCLTDIRVTDVLEAIRNLLKIAPTA